MIASNIALAVAYYLFAQIGLLVPSVGPMVSLIWPAAGLAVALTFRFGVSVLPGLFVGAYASNYGLCGQIASAGVASGVVLATALAVLYLHWKDYQSDFQSLADLKSFVIATIIASLISCLIGVGSLYGTEQIQVEQMGLAALNWYLGDAAGILILAPLILNFSSHSFRNLRRRGQLRGLIISFAVLGVITFVMYSGQIRPGRWAVPAIFFLLLLVARTASLYRVWPAALQLLIIAVCVIWNNHQLRGPGVYLEASTRIYAAWAFLVTGAVVTLGISCLLAERDSVERKLAIGEQTYRALVHDNPALICRFSTDGNLIFANETFRRTFDLSPSHDAEVTMRFEHGQQRSRLNYFTITGLDRDKRILTNLRELDAPERPIYFDTHQTSGPCAGRWYRWTARAVDIASSVVVEYHAVGLDITEQKRAENERKSLEVQAIQTQHYEAIGVLAGGISHEFNNILTGIIGNTDLALLMLSKPNEVRPMLGEVLRAAQRAAELTKQLSLYAGQTDTHPRPHKVNALVQSCERLLEVAIPKNCRFRHDSMTPDLQAVVDESKFRQLLLGLITNAAEAVADRPRIGEIVVRVARHVVESEAMYRNWHNGSELVAGEYVELDVSDNGCGMNASTLNRIFEPFFTTKFPGRGLGMCAVLGIVQDHSGAILVTSEVERGTTVRVLLPTRNSYIDSPTPLPRSIRRSSRLSASAFLKK